MWMQEKVYIEERVQSWAEIYYSFDSKDRPRGKGEFHCLP